jgi:radical SAM-linked protein
MRRARLPLAFTEGFSPRPKMRFGPALPTTFASSAEYIDLEFTEALAPDETAARLGDALPEGFTILAAQVMAEKGVSLQAAIVAAEYVVVAEDASGRFPPSLADEVAGALAASSLPTTVRKKGEDIDLDLRPGVLDACVVDSGSLPGAAVSNPAALPADLPPESLWCRLASQPRSYRPTEFLAALPSRPRARLVHRCAQLVRTDSGSFTEPIGLLTLQGSCDGPIRTQTQGSEEAWTQSRTSPVRTGGAR